jgi:hypothetical protein
MKNRRTAIKCKVVMDTGVQTPAGLAPLTGERLSPLPSTQAHDQPKLRCPCIVLHHAPLALLPDKNFPSFPCVSSSHTHDLRVVYKSPRRVTVTCPRISRAQLTRYSSSPFARVMVKVLSTPLRGPEFMADEGQCRFCVHRVVDLRPQKLNFSL